MEFCLAFDDDDKKKKDLPIVEPPTQPPTPPTPPTLQTASLTVNKTIFGCDIISGGQLACDGLPNNDPAWISCDTPPLSNTIFCTSLNKNSFDIEVNASNNQQIAQVEGSAIGTTIPNLQPGTYTVNEIENATNFINQLGENAFAKNL